MRTEVKHISYVHPDALAEYLEESTYDVVFEAVSKHVPRGAQVLDVGCGRGELMKRLSESGYDVYGCDMDDTCVKMARSYGEVRKLSVDEVSTDSFEGEFDCILMSHVLEHLENPREALKRLSSLLRGVMVISVPNPYYLPHVTDALLRRKINYVNTGHLQHWDWNHFKTFMEVGCDQDVLEWFYDIVPLPGVPLPGLRTYRRFLYKIGILATIEGGLLRAMLPRFCRSITAVTKPSG